MPTLSDLKAALEGVLGDPDLRAEVYARPLRNARLLTTGGRGPSTPLVSVADCANLLIAVMAPRPAIHAAKTVEAYRSLALLRRPPGPRGRRSARPLPREDLATLSLESIREVHLLGQAVELLLLRAADGSLRQWVRKWPGKPPEEAGLTLRLIGPRPAATLRLPMVEEKLVLPYAETPRTAGLSRRKNRSPGLVRAAEVYEDTVLALGELFRERAHGARRERRMSGS